MGDNMKTITKNTLANTHKIEKPREKTKIKIKTKTKSKVIH